MGAVNASALNSLQTRINAERSRRSLSAVTFTDGTLGAGGVIKASHFNELRSYTETLDTLGSQTFGWSGTVSIGDNITEVLTQIGNFCTTLEGETLASWKTLTPISTSIHEYQTGWNTRIGLWQVPSSSYSAGLVRWRVPSHNVAALDDYNMIFLYQHESNSTTTALEFGSWSGGNHMNANFHRDGTPHGGSGHPSNITGRFNLWWGSMNDQAYPIPDQTPWQNNPNKGSNSGGDNSQAYNGGHGTISASWYGDLGYVATTNHWYNTVKDFPSSHSKIVLYQFGNSAVEDYTSSIEIQAYY